MIGFILGGIFLFIMGVMMIVAPDALYRLNDFLNKIIFHDQSIKTYRLAFGVLLIAIGSLLIYVYYHYFY